MSIAALGESSMLALERLAGLDPGIKADPGFGAILSYYVEKADDPLDILEAADELLGEATGTARPRIPPDEIGQDRRGHYTLGGRTCCFTFTQLLLRRASSLPEGSEHECKACGCIWRLRYGVTAGGR